MPFRPPTPEPLRPGTVGGFSLIEVVLALGLASFALIGILGMFPVALGTAQDAIVETRVALIAQNIFADLREGAPSAATIVTGPNALENVETINLTAPSLPPPVFVAYAEDGTARAKISLTEFDRGLIDNQAFFLAAIDFADAVPTDPVLSDLVRVNVRVVAPSSRGALNRGAKTHEFVTWMSKR